MKNLLFLLLAGCRVVYPGDGRPVYVQFDNDVLERQVSYRGGKVRLAPFLEESLKWWRDAGVGFERQTRDRQPAIPVHDGAWWEGLQDGAWADYVHCSGEIYLFLDRWGLDEDHDDRRSLDRYVSALAHELGHAIGLDHDPHVKAVMYAAPPAATELSEYDLEQLAKVWP